MSNNAIPHDKAKQLLLSLSEEFEALRKGDAEKIMNLFAAHPVWHLPLEIPRVQTGPAVCEGKEAITALLKYVMKGFAAPPRWTFLRVITDENNAAIQMLGHCITHEGTPYDNRYCIVLAFKDGLIEEVHEYLDTKVIEQAYAKN